MDRALGRKYPGIRASREAQGEIGSFTERAIPLGRNEKEYRKSGTARYRPKRMRFTERDLVREI